MAQETLIEETNQETMEAEVTWSTRPPGLCSHICLPYSSS